MRLIDADALFRHLSDWQYGEMTDGKHDTEYGIIENVIEDIQMEPTIDAVPVIRCKDCFFRYNGIDDSPCDRYNMPMDLPDDFYCASGVRK